MKFFAELNLAKLGRWLRGLGYDTEITSEADPKKILAQAKKNKRILLTRNRSYKKGENICLVESEDLDDQLTEVLLKLELKPDKARLFTRCMACNGLLEEKEKTALKDKVPPKAFDFYNKFWQCTKCGKAYWQGTHWEKIQEKLNKILAE